MYRTHTRYGVINHTVWAFLFLAAVTLVGCMRTSTSTAGQGTGAGAFDDEENGERETVLIEPRDGADTAYDIRAARLDTALIRVQEFDDVGAIVEVLIKGAFSDGCTELDELDQEPSRGGQDVTLTMRRPSEAICTQVVRPYRFFFTLDRRFEPGQYVLSINGRQFNFEVR